MVREVAIEMPMDFDFLLFTNRGQLPIERKQIPSDLISSVQDGRLARELVAMRQVSQFPILLLHGRFTYNKVGELVMGGHGRKWTKRGIRNLLRTLKLVEGVFIEQAETDAELLEIFDELQEYFDKSHHLALRTRPPLDSSWLTTTTEEKVRYFYSGLPKIGPVLAKSLAHEFPSPMNLYQASVADIMQVSRFGRSSAERVYRFLREG